MSSVEDRLSMLETQVTVLQQQLGPRGRNEDWLNRVSGSFRNEPDFDEILRLGREIREQDKPDSCQTSAES
jgi:hypothetical protein